MMDTKTPRKSKRKSLINMTARTAKKVVLEISAEGISKKGFDYVWDKVRDLYPENQYKLRSFEASPENDEIIFCEFLRY